MTHRAAWTAVFLTGLLTLSSCKKATPPPPPPVPSCDCGARICGTVCTVACGESGGICPDDGVCSDDGLSCRPALPIGAACASDIDCGEERLCLTSGSVQIPNGYCSKRCGGAETCPEGSTCEVGADGNSRCLAKCAGAGDCRTDQGYQCDPDGYCQACVGSCSGKVCGEDGCGNPCGTAQPMLPVCNDASQVCAGGQCQGAFSSAGELCCSTMADYRGWWDGAAFDFNGDVLLLGGREVQRLVQGNETKGVDRVVRYSTSMNAITAVLTKLPKPIARPQAAFVGNYIYVAGGTTDSDVPGAADVPQTDVYKYDDNKVWVPMGSIPAPATTEGALVSLGDRLYLIGGSTADGNASTQVHVADPVGSTINWDQPTAPPQRTIARKLFDAVSDGSRIWVVGGWDGSHALATVETFDPNDGWKLSKPLPVAVVDARAVFSGGKIYVFGGWNGGSHYNDSLGLVQMIDTKTGRTTIIGRTPDYLSGQVPVALHDGRAFTFGAFEFGIGGISEHPEVYSFAVPSP